VDKEFPRDEIPKPNYLKGHYYKRVTEKDMGSPIRRSGKIHYNVGSVVNGGPRGIYVWGYPKRDAYTEGGEVVVELLPVSYPVSFSGSGYPASPELKVLGDLKVVRSFRLPTDKAPQELYDKWRNDYE
jgi:hypothetical protein